MTWTSSKPPWQPVLASQACINGLAKVVIPEDQSGSWCEQEAVSTASKMSFGRKQAPVPPQCSASLTLQSVSQALNDLLPPSPITSYIHRRNQLEQWLGTTRPSVPERPLLGPPQSTPVCRQPQSLQTMLLTEQNPASLRATPIIHACQQV